MSHPSRTLHGLGRRPLASLWTRLRPASAGVDEANAWKLYVEAFWTQAHGAVAQFHAPYALHLGATNAEIGLLTSLPALLALLVGMPAGYLFSRQTRRRLWIGTTIFVHRLSLLLAAFIPLLTLARPGTAMVWLVIIFAIPGHAFTVAWNPSLADVIPEQNRARVFATRNTLAAVALTGGLYLAGRWLAMGTFPANYQVMYLVAFAGSLISTLFCALITLPPAKPAPAGWPKLAPATLLAQVKKAAATQPDFARITINTFAHGIGLWMIAPVYVLYYVRTLHASDSWIALNLMLASLSPVIGYGLWRRAIDRWGENRMLKWSISLFGLYPVLVGLTSNLTLILVWTTLSGLVAAGITLSHFNMLLKVAPDGERTTYLAAYTTILNAGAFVMPLVGVYLAERLGFAAVLVAGGLLCLAGSSTFVWRPLRSADSLALRRRLA